MDPLMKRAKHLLKDLQRVPAAQYHMAAQHRTILTFALNDDLVPRNELEHEVERVERWLRTVYRQSWGLCSVW